MGIGRLLLAVFLATGSAGAQWEILPSGNTADLRGIDAVRGGIAWASGTNGTVLRTVDGGKSWKHCATPPGAEHLDFRAVQAFDGTNAIVVSSGKGPLSRVYKTTNACQSWTLLFTNPDADGFFDALQFSDRANGIILGDPVNGSMALWTTHHGGTKWTRVPPDGLKVPADTGAFAASNSSLLVDGRLLITAFVTGGPQPAIYWRPLVTAIGPYAWKQSAYWSKADLPLAKGATAGAYSIASNGDFNLLGTQRPALFTRMVVVGGDYQKAGEAAGTAAFTNDGGRTWYAARTSPHGFRSAVAYDSTAKTWITVGPNGTDVSPDDGRDWRALKPSKGEPSDVDQHWNALSLPFVVGPHGRIGKLRADALKQSAP
ncbi:MAG TPA: hypothetical protein VGN01_17195 [Acidobacteriaceae bacterium]|jgi:photosystem II stability/assembly factor-like uncharacterized protein